MENNDTKTQTGDMGTVTNHSNQSSNYPSHQQLQDEVTNIPLRPLNEGYDLLNQIITVDKNKSRK